MKPSAKFLQSCLPMGLLLAACLPAQVERAVSVTATIPSAASPNAAVAPPDVGVTAAPPEPTATEKQPPARLIVCIADTPVEINPYTTVSTNRSILQAVNDGPVDWVDFQYRPVLLDGLPDLASGEVQLRQTTVREGDRVFDPVDRQVHVYTGSDTTMDQMVVRFRLRNGVRWSDGQPLTASDSVYTWELLSASPPILSQGWQAAGEALVLRTVSYRALDEQTVEWVGVPGLVTGNYPGFFVSPLPRHLGMRLDTPRPEVGWGPFRMAGWSGGQHLIVARNPWYFRSAEGLPRVDEVEFRFLAPPYGDQPGMLSEGGCHIISASISYYTPAETWVESARTEGFRLVSVPSNSGWQLVFNLADGRGSSPVQDVTVRRAISLCIDRASLAERFAGFVSDSYAHPRDPLHAAVLSDVYDSVQARHMLEQAGRVAQGSSTAGLNLTLALSESESARLIGQEIVAYLAQCGVAVQAEYFPAETFYLPWPEGPAYGGMYDMVLWGLGAVDEPACYWYHSANAPSASKPDGLNLSGLRDAEFDRLCERALVALDPKDRARLHREAQVRWAELLPALPLLWRTHITGVSCQVRGYSIDPGLNEFWNIEEVSLGGECN